MMGWVAAERAFHNEEIMVDVNEQYEKVSTELLVMIGKYQEVMVHLDKVIQHKFSTAPGYGCG